LSNRVEVKLSDQGEIMLRSPALMKGYYKEPEKTAEVLRDGWYYTGDAGRFDEDGNLWITGRVSEVFKTTKGKFVRPTNLENHFGRSELLSQERFRSAVTADQGKAAVVFEYSASFCFVADR
jgi:long-chain acyl-CoA synthetase